MVNEVFILEKGRMPFVRIFLYFALGIILRSLLPVTLLSNTVLFILMLLVISIFLYLMFLRRGDMSRCLSILVFIILLLFGALVQQLHEPRSSKGYFEHYSGRYLIGKITDEPVERDKNWRFPFRIDYVVDPLSQVIPAEGNVMLTIEKKAGLNKYLYGDQLLIPNQVIGLSKAYNPKQFDYAQYLENKSIYHQSYLLADNTYLLYPNKGNVIVSKALQLRENLVNKFKVFIADSTALQVSSALIFGYRQDFSPELLDAFVKTGTVHVLSVSGLHVGIVFLLLNSILRHIDRYRYGRLFRLYIVLLAVWMYVILTGMAPAILRAGIMISFFLVSELSGRKQNNLNTLFSSAFFLLLINPKLLYDVGFQLSYTAVLGLFTIYPLLNTTFRVKHKLLNKIKQYIAISVAAQLFTAPLVLYYFHQFPNYFLLGNLFIAIPSTFLMYFGIALAVSPLHFLNAFLADVIQYLNTFILSGLTFVERLPYAVLSGVDFSMLQVLLLYSIIILITLGWNKRVGKKIIISLLLLIILIVTFYLNVVRLNIFHGVKIYNINNDFVVAFFKSGKVSLFSNINSLHDAKLKYNVWPDIERYTTISSTNFENVKITADSTAVLRGYGMSVAVINGEYIHSGVKDSDLILFRGNKNNRLDLNIKEAPDVPYIFDGSNTNKNVEKLALQADSLKRSYYILKDNFSYVWSKQD